MGIIKKFRIKSFKNKNSLIEFENISLSYGNRLILDNINFKINEGEIFGMLGPNGVGKSTLLDLIVGDLSTSKGSIDMPRSWRVGYMPQEVDASPQTAINYVIDGHSELREVERKIAGLSEDEELANLYLRYEDLGGYEAESRAGRILNGLGFHAEDFEKPFEQFSGGWRIRLNLAKALMLPSQLLVLDEPTNHLDVEAILWLEKWLLDFDGLLVMVAHDRFFLDSVATDILHISDSVLRHYSGNYSSFERARAEQILQQRAAIAKQDRERKRIKQFVDRFRAKASKAKQVQSRIKALERLTEQSLMAVDSDYRVSFEEPEKISNPLLSFRKLSVGYNSELVLQEISQSILPGARIGLLGANGAGKSTVMKALLGMLKLTSGSVDYSNKEITTMLPQNRINLGLAFVPQTQNVFTGMTVEENLEMGGFLREDEIIHTINDVFDLFPILKEKRNQNTGELSGGQRQQVAFGRALMTSPNILMLDEPTAGVSPIVMDELFSRIIEVRKTGVGILMVEQNAKQALSIANRGYVLVNGKNSHQGSGEELLNNPEVRKSFLGG